MKKISLLLSMIFFILMGGFSQTNWDEAKAEEFIKDLYLKNKLEINLGQLTFTKNVQPDLMELGMMIVKDHEKANMKLKKVAEDMDIELPEELAAKHDNKIEHFYRLNPVDFADEYVDMLVKHHEKTIDNLKEAKDKISNNEFQQWVDNTLPLLKDHLEGAKEMQDMNRWKAKDRKLRIEGDVLDEDM